MHKIVNLYFTMIMQKFTFIFMLSFCNFISFEVVDNKNLNVDEAKARNAEQLQKQEKR